jgi:hypothetical protein
MTDDAFARGFIWCWTRLIPALIGIKILFDLVTPAHAELPIYVDTYRNGVVVDSKWYCSNGKRVPCDGYPTTYSKKHRKARH